MRAFERLRGQYRLPQADSAVVRRNRAIRPDFVRLRLKKSLQILQEHDILKHASGKNDRVDLPSPCKYPHGLSQALRNSQLERTSDLVGITPAQAIMNQQAEQRTKVQFITSKWERISLCGARRPREIFQP